MRRLLILWLISFSWSYSIAQEAVVAKNPDVIIGQLIKVTKDLRSFTLADKAIPDVRVRDEDGIIGKDEEFEEGSDPILYPTKGFTVDPALQTDYPSKPHTQSAVNRAITGNFAGMPYQPLNPPDPTMCVGPNHVIQMINGSSGALFKVYNKSGGQVVAQTYLDAITGKGGLGDPIALYDQLADRFVLTEFANKPETGTEGLIVAITKTNDPAGQWYVYFFSTGNTFPDYPKFSVWPDAYYGTTNDFANASNYSGSSVYAFDRAKMIAGNSTATMQKFTLGTTSKFFSMCPVSLEGTSLPPSGTGGLIAYMADDAWTSTTADVDSIGLLEFKVDFATPSNSRVTAKSSLAAAAYKSDICTTTRGQCITQPGSSVKVEALHQKIMNKPIYRNFAGYEGIVMSHVVDKGSNISGVRWYELRKTTGNWSVYQQSTYAPDNTQRWMPGICYDVNGNVALAYNVSSSATGVYPGARYTGRQQCDPLNTMTYSENVIIAGTAANGSTRYGDYNELVCDPDGITFWFTCEYNAASTWSTRIASFTLDPCNATTCGDPNGLSSSAITTTSATISWTVVTNALSYDVDYKASTSSTWINAATALNATSKSISGLTQGTTYDWRVRANCSGGSGNYVSAQFTTTSTGSCNAPSGLNAAPSPTTGYVYWSAVSGANSYDVDYKATSSSTWINVATAIPGTYSILSNLVYSTSYDWRVRSNCPSGNSSYSSGQFSTAAASGCIDPTNLNSSVTTNSATVSWNSASGSTSYRVDYRTSNSGAWVNAVASTTNTSFTISGLSLNTSYDWRVRSYCSSGSSGFSLAQFITGAASVCNPPSGLNSSGITTSSANVSWSSVSGANSYDVGYKANSSSTWISAATGTTSTSIGLSGLTSSTLYDWRVRTNCSSGSSTYSTSQFTTNAAAVCNPPSGLAANSITSVSATVTWGSVSGANNYNIDYKLNSSSTWISAATATTSTSINLGGLSSSSLYDWRVRSNCSSGSSSYATSQFTTSPVSGCTDQYESNDVFGSPAPVPTGVDLSAQINSVSDVDYYSFTNTASQRRISVTLTNLPADYDMQLFRTDGFLLRTSQNRSTANESFTLNTNTIGTYIISVYGYNGAFSSSQCYTLNIQLSATNFSPEAPVTDVPTTIRSGLRLYPVPASNMVTVAFDAYKNGMADISITNPLGQQVLHKTVGVGDGINYNNIDVSRLGAGMYFVKVNNGDGIQTQKLIISR